MASVDKTTTYEAKQVAQVIPPEVSLRHDARNKPQDDQEDGQTDEDGVDRDEGSVGLDREAAHARGEVFGGCSIYQYLALSSAVHPLKKPSIPRASLIVQDDVIHAVATLLSLSSLQMQSTSVSAHVVWVIAV